MVLQVLPDARQITDYGNIKCAHMPRRAHAGEHKQLRRADGAGAQDNLALRTLLHASVAVLEADDGRAPAFKVNAKNLRVCADGQIRARHDWMQKRCGGAVAFAVGLRDLIEAEAFL